MVEIVPTQERVDCSLPLPAYLTPMLHAGQGTESLVNAVGSIVTALGFESFVYGMSLARTHHRDERFYVWGTVSRDWLSEYDQKSYIEIDPRVQYGWDFLPPPLIWDGRIADGNPFQETFLKRAAEFGIGSGIAVYLRDDRSKIMVALSCRERFISDRRRSEICSVTGQIMHLASTFHWIFVKQIVARDMPAAQQGHPLSPREVTCLQYSAHGMTSKDISLKVGIKERTVNFHFANTISKLGVLNRQEAIAMAVDRGLIEINSRLCKDEPCRRR